MARICGVKPANPQLTENEQRTPRFTQYYNKAYLLAWMHCALGQPLSRSYAKFITQFHDHIGPAGNDHSQVPLKDGFHSDTEAQ